MNQQERWDVVLKLLNGPMKGVGEQKLRGPVIRLGANPGPGGVQLAGYRGLDARQCVITAYTGGTASVAPVGTNQVRLAPHSNVNWRDIDPITGPEYLTPACALHLGPVGRGATIEFVRCERFGQWQEGQLASEAADVPSELGRQEPGRSGPVPASYDARRVGMVRTSMVPFWFLGCMTVMSGVTVTLLVLIGAFRLLIVQRKAPGPVEEGVEFYRSVDASQFTEQDEMLLKGLEQGYYAFVVSPNIVAAGSAAKEEWAEMSHFDPMFLRYVTKSVDKHLSSWSFFRRIDAVHVEYGKVVLELRKAGLPEVFAAIPYQESRYNASMTSPACAEGYWQFMPESALRVHQQSGETFRVQSCSFMGNSKAKWAPTEIAPPPNVYKNADYINADRQCQIDQCAIDDRKDLGKSTRAAIFTLSEAWNDPLFAESGSAVQLTITSHNAGYDDSRFGQKFFKRFNVKPAYKNWIKKNGASQGVFFTGQNIRCAHWEERSPCGGAYMAETQHYAYNIVAQHLLAVCYYARNYGENPAYTPWRKYVASGGYCDTMDIPTNEEVRSK